MVSRLAPFPLVVAGAALVGFLMRNARRSATGARIAASPFLADARDRHRAMGSRPRSQSCCSPGRIRCSPDIYRFFTTAALVTFGGAYAVLAWVNQQAVEVYGLAHAGRDRRRSRACGDDARAPDHRAAIRRIHGGLEPAWRRRAAGRRDDRRVARFLGHLPAVLRIHPGRRALRRKAVVQRAAVDGACLHDGCRRRRDRQPRHRFRPQCPVPRRPGRRPTGPRSESRTAAFVLLQWTRVDAIWVIAGGAAAGLALAFV